VPSFGLCWRLKALNLCSCRLSPRALPLWLCYCLPSSPGRRCFVPVVGRSQHRYTKAWRHRLVGRLPICRNPCGCRDFPANLCGCHQIRSNLCGCRKVPSNLGRCRKIPSNLCGCRIRISTRCCTGRESAHLLDAEARKLHPDRHCRPCCRTTPNGDAHCPARRPSVVHSALKVKTGAKMPTHFGTQPTEEAERLRRQVEKAVARVRAASELEEHLRRRVEKAVARARAASGHGEHLRQRVETADATTRTASGPAPSAHMLASLRGRTRSAI